MKYALSGLVVSAGFGVSVGWVEHGTSAALRLAEAEARNSQLTDHAKELELDKQQLGALQLPCTAFFVGRIQSCEFVTTALDSPYQRRR